MSSILVGDVLEHAEMLYGDRPAIVDGDTQFTYAEVGRRIRRLAGGCPVGCGCRRFPIPGRTRWTGSCPSPMRCSPILHRRIG